MVARSGVDFPGSAAARDAWFPDDESCLDYLDWLRWERGFRCPHCDGRSSWRLVDGRRSCATCARRVSPTAGTVLHRSRSPLPVWFAAAWALTADGGGTSAAGLQRDLALTSYQTAWTMLHRYRRAMAGAGGVRLRGLVDAAIVRLDAARGPASSLDLAVAVERRGTVLGRCRLRLLQRDGAAIRSFLDDVEPGTELRSGGPSWRSFLAPARALGLLVQPDSGPASPAGAVATEVAALVGDWLRGPLHGAVGDAHLPGYLDEFSFRFDGGRAAPPGLLFHRLLGQVVVTPPVRASELVAVRAPRATSPTPPRPRRAPHVRRVTSGLDHPWRRP